MIRSTRLASFRFSVAVVVICVGAAANSQSTGQGLEASIQGELRTPLKTPTSSFTFVKSWSVVGLPAKHQSGHAVPDIDAEGGQAWEARTSADSTAGALIYGPYLPIPAGRYAAFFRIKLIDEAGEDEAATLDASSDFGMTPLRVVPITGSDLRRNHWVEIPLFFTFCGHSLECRATWQGYTSLRFDKITLYRIDGPVLDGEQERAQQPTSTGKPNNLTPINEKRPYASIFPRSAPPDPNLVVVDLRKQTPDWQYVAFSVQGIVNRVRPQIYCLTNDQDAEWLKYMQKRGWINGSATVSSPADLLHRFSSSIKGVIVTDPALPASKNVATMLAGIDDAVVATPKMAKTLNMRTIEDLRGRWKTSAEAYRWAFDTLWPKLNHHLIACSFPDQLPLRDYLIENHVFIFWLSGPIDGARPYATPQKELELMEQLLAKMPVNIPVMSYPYAGKDIGIGEGPGVTLFAEFGKYLVGTTDTSNLSVHSGIPIRTLRQKPAPPAPALDRNKIYVSYIMSDGDNLPVLTTYNFPALWSDSLRGSIPIGWSASPSAVMLIPDIMDYYYSTSTSNDVWLGAVSGIGYTYPDSYGLRFREADRSSVFDGFLRQTDEYMAKMDERMLWPMNLTHPEMISRYASKIPSLTALFPDYGRRVSDYQDATYSTARNVPVFCAVTRWTEHASDEEQISGLVSDIKAMTPATRPAFLHLFIWNWGAKLSILAEVLHRLGPDYEAVRPDHLAALYRNYMAEEKLVLHTPSTLIALGGMPIQFSLGIQNVTDKPVDVHTVKVSGLKAAEVTHLPGRLAPAEQRDVLITGTPDGYNIRVIVDTSAGDKTAQPHLRTISPNELSNDAGPGLNLTYVRHYSAVDLAHRSGALERDADSLGGTVWAAEPGKTESGYLLFGPYESMPPGKYLAVFRMKRVSRGSGEVATIDTCVGGGKPVTSEHKISAADLPEGKYRSFECLFDHPGGALETRLLWTGAAKLLVDSVTLWSVRN